MPAAGGSRVSCPPPKVATFDQCFRTRKDVATGGEARNKFNFITDAANFDFIADSDHDNDHGDHQETCY